MEDHSSHGLAERLYQQTNKITSKKWLVECKPWRFNSTCIKHSQFFFQSARKLAVKETFQSDHSQGSLPSFIHALGYPKGWQFTDTCFRLPLRVQSASQSAACQPSHLHQMYSSALPKISAHMHITPARAHQHSPTKLLPSISQVMGQIIALQRCSGNF